MKVIHLISGGDTGGARTHVYSLLKYLGQIIDVQLVCFRGGDFADGAAALGIPTMVLGKGFLANLGALKRIIRDGEYDIVHCHGSMANVMGAMLRPSVHVPVISTVHSDYRLDYLGRPFARAVYGTLNTWALHQLDYRVCVSDPIRQRLIDRGFEPNRLFSIYNGLDFSHVVPKTDRAAYFAQFGYTVHEGDVIAGIAARLDPVKDIPTLLRAVALAKKACPQLRLAIAGDGKERKKLEALTKELDLEDSVFFLGWVNDLDSFYGALDINTLSSVSEAFPYALPEGARAHLATVASNVGGVPAIIEHGVTGLLIEPGDVRMLAAYLARYALDENYRREMGEALYRRGKADFSEEATGLRQLEIYHAVFRMERNRRDGVRDGVLICGAYGFGNTGDDAILQAIIGEMRRIDPHMPVTVLSRRPQDTRSTCGVNACHRFHLFAIRRILRRSQLFISGGGSLMQDVTSRLSLWYYLGTIRMAHRCGCKVQMYGCGIGPIVYERDRQLAARIINDCVDKITLREPDSRETLSDFGVTDPEVILASDPALTLPAAERSRIDRILREHDMDPEGKYIGFVLRKWPGIEEKATVFAAGAVYAYLKHGLTPVFLSINFRTDGEASRLVTEHLSIPYYMIDEQMSTGEVIGVLSRMTTVVSMRLHGLIFAAGQGVPLIGVAYDPKVTAFLDYVEQNNYMQFEALNEKDLSDLIDSAVALAGRGEELRRRTELLNRQEDNNRATAARLLGKEKTSKMIRSAVLVSGKGTKLQSLLDSVFFGEIPELQLVAVISSDANAYALKRARNAGIETVVVEPAMFPNDTSYDMAIRNKLKDMALELVINAGFYPGVGRETARSFHNKVIAVQPSLIPAFETLRGDAVHEAVLARGLKVTGATAYLVDENGGVGPVLLQKAVPVLEDDDLTTLKRRVLTDAEWKLLPEAVKRFCAGKIRLHGGRAQLLE